MPLLLAITLLLLITPGQLLRALPIEGKAATAEGQCTYFYTPAPDSQKEAPLLVFLHGNERADRQTVEGYHAQWQSIAQQYGWHLLLPWSEGRYSFTSDAGVQAVESVLASFETRFPVDARRIYLVGHGDSAPAVFYALSRLPQRWAAGLAIGGDAGRAIETNRLFAANSANSPLLWIYETGREDLLSRARRQLEAAGFNATFQAGDEFRVEQAMQWLSPHTSTRLPLLVEYESGEPRFPGAWWVRIRDFDFTLRNDVLPSSRVDPGTGAFLRLGGFGYNPNGEGPGLAVKWLPDNYKGPLQLDDQIVSIAGTMIQDATHYAEFMESQRESRDVGIILLRNGKSLRVETRIVIPKREEVDTARVRAEYLEDLKEVLLVSRGASRIELQIAKPWAPVKISWNGEDVARDVAAGCWILTQANPVTVSSCPSPGPQTHSITSTPAPTDVARPR